MIQYMRARTVHVTIASIVFLSRNEAKAQIEINLRLLLIELKDFLIEVKPPY